jgi:hypothetical protein
VKLILFFVIGTICGAAWMLHGVPGSPKASPAAAPAAAIPVRMSKDQYAEALRKNASVRENLAKRYPDSYRQLEQQAKRDLKDCVVTQLIDGVLKAACQ